MQRSLKEYSIYNNNEQNQEDQEGQEDQELRNEERVTGREEEYSSTNDNGSIGTFDIDNDEDNNNNNDNDNANNNDIHIDSSYIIDTPQKLQSEHYNNESLGWGNLLTFMMNSRIPNYSKNLIFL